MTLKTLLGAANTHYDEHALAHHYDEQGRVTANPDEDILAAFIVGELEQTYNEDDSDEQQLEQALEALDVLRRDVEAAIRGLQELQDSSEPA